MKALSPGVNDTTTAVMCVDYLTAILVRLAPRRIAAAHRLDQGELRVIARGPSFAGLLSESFDQIRQNADGNVAVLLRMLGALETIASRTLSPDRRRVLGQTLDEIAEAAERTIDAPHDRARLGNRLTRVREVLAPNRCYSSAHTRTEPRPDERHHRQPAPQDQERRRPPIRRPHHEDPGRVQYRPVRAGGARLGRLCAHGGAGAERLFSRHRCRRRR